MCLAVPGKILEISGDDPQLRSAKVSFGGAIKTVNISFLSEAKVGDYVLAHVGFALNIIDEEEANRTMEYIKQMGDVD